MPGEKNSADPDSSNVLKRKIAAATLLPTELVSLVNAYAGTPPDQQMISAVNHNLKMLSEYAEKLSQERPGEMKAEWYGVSVMKGVEARARTNAHNEGDTDLDLSRLRLNGIIFGELNGITTHVRSERDVIDTFLRWLQPPEWGNDKQLSILDLSGDSLIDARFEGIMCSGFNFANATLTNASFKNSVLTGARFINASMENADLSFCYAVPCKLYRSRSDRTLTACFEVVEMKSDDELFPDFVETEFFHANLFQANLFHGNFNGVKFDDTTLDHANLSEGHFDRAVFQHCSMLQSTLCKTNFLGAKFLMDTSLSGANATGAIFTNVDFTGANLQDAILSEAHLTGAVFKGANLTGALLNGAHFNLNQFSKEQVLSFHYIDQNAQAYITAIYDYMTQDESKHRKGFERARRLILSFIDNQPYVNGENKLLVGFLLTGKLSGESGSGYSLFSSSESDVNSLRAQLKDVSQQIEASNTPATSSPTIKKKEGS